MTDEKDKSGRDDILPGIGGESINDRRDRLFGVSRRAKENTESQDS